MQPPVRQPRKPGAKRPDHGRVVETREVVNKRDEVVTARQHVFLAGLSSGASVDHSPRSSIMSDPETFFFEDDGRFPNSTLPLLVHREALPPDATAMEQAFAANGWSGSWRNGIFAYHHFHSTGA